MKEKITSEEAVRKLRELFGIGGGPSTEDNGTFGIMAAERTRTEAVKMIFDFAAEYDITDGEILLCHAATGDAATVFTVAPRRA